ncbi:MAG: hypothetical protein PHQ64_01405 [Bacilli bacterium]|nr:hypothetical protein [Bacilli bacterium]
MYIEENQRRRLPFVDFLLKLVLMIVFVLLLVWLIPWPNNDALKDQIFNANLQEMKDAAIMYFTTERLPEEVGDKVTLTLQEMLDLKLLLPFVDKNGDSCDLTESYVSLEKMENEYLMKVNLKCSDQEDYILVHLGCYSYCEDTLCEKQEDNDEKPTVVKPTTKPVVIKPTTTVKPTVTPTIKPTPTPTNTPVVEKEYEYKRNVAATYSAWTAWNEYTYTANDNIPFGLTATKEIVDLGTRQVVDYYKSATYKTVLVEKEEFRTVDNVPYQVCTGFNYEVFGDTLYSVSGNWVNTGIYAYGYSVPAAATSTTRWVAVGVDWNVCGSSCTNSPYIKWEKQTRSASSTSTVANKVTVTCASYETRNVPVIIKVTVPTSTPMLLEPAQTIYKTVSVYKIRVRQLLTAAYSQYTWSTYNNLTLINQGYSMTGNSRNK